MAKSLLGKARERTGVANRGAQKRGAFGKIPAKDVYLRMDLQHWEYIYCHHKITLFTCELDHIHAIAKGGEHYLYNIVLTCHRCNQSKGSRTLKRFCFKMGFDLERIREDIAELNALQHSLTNFDDEYANDTSKWSI